MTENENELATIDERRVKLKKGFDETLQILEESGNVITSIEDLCAKISRVQVADKIIFVDALRFDWTMLDNALEYKEEYENKDEDWETCCLYKPLSEAPVSLTIFSKGRNAICAMCPIVIDPPKVKRFKPDAPVVIRPEFSLVRKEIFNEAKFIFKFIERKEGDLFCVTPIYKVVYSCNGSTEEEALEEASGMAFQELSESNNLVADERMSNYNRLEKALDELGYTKVKPTTRCRYRMPAHRYAGSECRLITLNKYKDFFGETLDQAYERVKASLQPMAEDSRRLRKKQ